MEQFVISLEEMLDGFRQLHSSNENDEFDEFLGNPIFMKIIEVKPIEAFGSKLYFT